MASVSWSGTLRRVNTGSLQGFGSLTSGFDNDASAISGFGLPASWLASNPIAYVRIFWIQLGSGGPALTLRLASSDSGIGAENGPDLTDALEASLDFTLEVGSETLEVSFADAVSTDDSEPYSVSYDSNGVTGTAISQFLADLPIGLHATTLTLDDGISAPSFADDTGDAISGTVGTAIANVTVPEAAGAPDPTYAASGLPGGLSFNTTTRVLSGTPTAAGSGTITVTATNSEGSADWTVAYSFVAATEAPSWADNTGDAISGTVGTAIALINVPEADGNPAPTYAAVGTLPDGIIFIGLLLTISGTPTAAATGTIRIRATNSEGTADWTVAYSFVHPPEPHFEDDTGDPVDWFVGIEIPTFVVPEAEGTPAPTYAVVGSLPGGIGFDPLTRRISGTPTAAGTGTITIRATNSEGTDDWFIVYTTTAPLVLADSDDTGLDVDCKALLVASDDATAGNFFYSDADRGGTDTPLDGELGLGADDTVISGIRRRTATLLQLNDSNNPAALDIGDYFSTGGAGSDLTVYLQTLAGEVSFPATASFSRVDQVRFTLPADAQTLLDNLEDGDRWIFKTAREAAPETQALAMEATAGDPTAAFALSAVAPPAAQALSVSAVAGDPTASFDLRAVAPPTSEALSVEATAGNPTADFNLAAVAPPATQALSVEAEAGAPTATFDLRAVAPTAAAALSMAARSWRARRLHFALSAVDAVAGSVRLRATFWAATRVQRR